MKHISIFVVTLAALLLLAACSPADSPNPPATTGNGGTVTEGPADDPVAADYRYTVSDGKAVIVSYVGAGGDVTVPEKLGGYPVSAIGNMAFAYNDTITSLTLPGTFPASGYLAFYSCENLKTLTLGEGMTTVERGAFANCTALETVNFPASLTTLDASAFKGCSSLKSVDLTHITKLGDACFARTGLTSVSVPSCEVGDNLFCECGELTTVTWAAGTVQEQCFAYCYKLSSVTLQEGLYAIRESAFRRCSSLRELTLPASVSRIYTDCLMGCTSLETVRILNPNFGRFYSQSFHWLPALKDVYFAGTEAQWNAIENYGENEALSAAAIHFGA